MTKVITSKSQILTAVLITCLILMAAQAHGATGSIPLFNTGVGSGAAILANNVADPHYSLISAPSPYTTAMTGNGANDFAWLADGPNSRWIGVTAWLAEWVPIGNYTFRTTFDLTGFDPNTAALSLRIASDNACKVFLNGSDTGIATTSEAFTSFSDFNLNTGFGSGLNTLDFVVNNATTPGAPTHNPMGLRVELSGLATVVPEPATTALVLLGVMLGGIQRRRH